MPPRTLHVTNAFHSASGGISTFYRCLLEAANRQGRYMSLAVPAEKSGFEQTGPYGRIYYVASPRAPIVDKRYRVIMPTSYAPPFGGALRRVLLEEQPDLLEICDKYSINWLAGFVRKGMIAGLKRPVIVGLSSERMDDSITAAFWPGNGGRSFARRYMSWIYAPLFDYHLANSEYTAAEVFQALKGKSAGRVHICPNGVDCHTYHPHKRDEDARARFCKMAGGDRSSSLLLYAGRLSPEKNLGLLIESMKLLSQYDRDYRLAIAGDGPLASWFRNQIDKAAPGRTLMFGHLQDRGSLARLYASCDVFIHPNPREPFGIAPLEAMASGSPLVAPRSGGILSYANDQNCWLAEPNAESFARAVEDVLSDRPTRLDRISNARATAEAFDWSVVTDQLFKLYDHLCEIAPYSPYIKHRRTKS